MRKLLVHAVLIFLTAVILFPILWVVMTSLRRDEAAFSPKLFSTNLTLQHYRDLLVPDSNIPAIVRKLSNQIPVYPPYDKLEKVKLERRIEKNISRLNDYLERTRNLWGRAVDLNSDISSLLKSEFPSMMRDLISNMESLIEKLESVKSGCKVGDESCLTALAYLVKKTKRSDWISDVSNVDKSYLEDLYHEKIGRLISELNELKSEVEDLKSRLKRGNVSGELEELRMASGKILEDLVEKLAVFVNLLEVPGDRDFKTSEIAKHLEEILKIGDESVLYLFRGSLEEFVKYLGEDHSVPENVARTLENLELEILAMMRDLVDISNRMREFREHRVDLEKIKENLSIKIERLTRVESELERVMKDISDYLPGLYSAYLKADLNNKLKKLKSVDELNRKSLIKLDAVFRSLRSRIKEAREYRLSVDVISDLNELANEMEWISDYRGFSKAFSRLEDELPNLMGDFESELKSLEHVWKKLFEASIKGIKVSPRETENMYEILSTLYEGKVSSALGIAMREARALSDVFPIKRYRKSFKVVDATLYDIQQIWSKKPKHYFLRWVYNSVVVAGMVALITTLVCAVAAYPFSRMTFAGRRYGIMALLLIQMFPAIMYMVALYGMLKFLGSHVPWLGLDTLGGLIFVYLGGIAFNMYLIKGYYDTIPSSLEESAMIDGATRFQTFWFIVIPLARPILAVVVILTFIGTFNEFVLARIILQDVKNYTYALGLWTFSTGPFETEWGLFTAAALLGMLPMVLLFLSMQKFLISGLTKGSVKG